MATNITTSKPVFLSILKLIILYIISICNAQLYELIILLQVYWNSGHFQEIYQNPLNTRFICNFVSNSSKDVQNSALFCSRHPFFLPKKGLSTSRSIEGVIVAYPLIIL